MNIKSRIMKVIGWLAHKHLLGVSIVAASILLAAIIIATGPTAKPQTLKEKAWPVSIVTARPGVLSPVLTVYGKVESRQTAMLKTSVSAPVARVLTPEGTWVNKGDLLIALDTTELNLSLKSADADYKRRLAVLVAARNDYAAEKKMTAHYRALEEIAAAKLKRNRSLYRSKMISDSILDQARQQADQASITWQQHLAKLSNYPSLIDQDKAMVDEGKAMVDKAKLDLAQAEIRAPFAGRVIQTLVAPGDRIQPGVPLIQVADYSQLEVRAPMPADTGFALRQRIHEGAKVFAVAVVDSRHIRCKLDRLSGDVKTGQSGVDAFFSPLAPANLDIGRIVSLTVTMPPEQDVVALPVQSVYRGNRVYKVVKDRLVGVEVQQVGEYVNDKHDYRLLVRSPQIHKGDHLITTQLPRAISGLLVNPIDPASLDEALVGRAGHASNAGS